MTTLTNLDGNSYGADKIIDHEDETGKISIIMSERICMIWTVTAQIFDTVCIARSIIGNLCEHLKFCILFFP